MFLILVSELTSPLKSRWLYFIVSPVVGIVTRAFMPSTLSDIHRKKPEQLAPGECVSVLQVQILSIQREQSFATRFHKATCNAYSLVIGTRPLRMR